AGTGNPHATHTHRLRHSRLSHRLGNAGLARVPGVALLAARGAPSRGGHAGRADAATLAALMPPRAHPAPRPRRLDMGRDWAQCAAVKFAAGSRTVLTRA